MAKTNYEQTRDRVQKEFLKYPQEKMIGKFQLQADDRYLYIEFTGRMYRIDRASGKMEWSEDGFQNCGEADFNETLTILDVLCDSKDGCTLSGTFTRVNNMKGTVYSSGLGDDFFRPYRHFFDRHADKLGAACEKLGGVREEVGEISYRIPVFRFFPVILQYWEADEDFPSSLQILWDENTQDFMRYETTYYCAGHLLRRLREIMEGQS